MCLHASTLVSSSPLRAHSVLLWPHTPIHSRQSVASHAGSSRPATWPAPSLCAVCDAAMICSFITLVPSQFSTLIVLNQVDAQPTRRGWDKALSTSDRMVCAWVERWRWPCAVCGVGRVCVRAEICDDSLIPHSRPIPAISIVLNQALKPKLSSPVVRGTKLSPVTTRARCALSGVLGDAGHVPFVRGSTWPLL